jgi:hypothetical protein
MRYGVLLIVAGMAIQGYAQAPTGGTTPHDADRRATSRPYDETIALRKALAAARAEGEALRQQNVQLKAELKKAQNPAEQEKAWGNAKVDVGMPVASAAKIFELNRWRQNRQKSQDYIGKVPVDVEVWTRYDPNPEDFRASKIDARDVGGSDEWPKPGQPKTVIVINDVVVYVSPK